MQKSYFKRLETRFLLGFFGGLFWVGIGENDRSWEQARRLYRGQASEGGEAKITSEKATLAPDGG